MKFLTQSHLFSYNFIRFFVFFDFLLCQFVFTYLRTLTWTKLSATQILFKADTYFAT